MNRLVANCWTLSLCWVVLVSGCHSVQPFYFFEDGDLSHYKGVATEIEFPDDLTCTLPEVEGALPPLTLRNPDALEFWDLSLEETVQIALINSKVIRVTQANPTPTALLSAPDVAPTVYNPAIAETDPINGVEASLSAFDANFSTSVFWERNDRPVNVGGFAGLIFAPVFEQDLGTFQAQLQKTNATGGTTTVRHNVRYEWNNNPSRAVPSDWTVDLEAEWRQPLLQGAGVEFNRIAGPNAQPGFFFSRGVLISRINSDIALADFESDVRNLVNSVENAYWELYFAYRNLDAVRVGRDSALQTWRKVHALYIVGGRGGEAENEAQAREQYYLFRAQVETALSQLYAAENQLRFILGLSATDSRLIRPCEEPSIGRVTFDWYAIHTEALVRGVELRRQKFRIKQRELELVASRNFLLPRLDVVGRYRWTGLGDELIDPNGQGIDLTAPSALAAIEGSDAYATLTDGNFQEWQLGLQASMPIGFRREHSGVRNAQLNLARDRAVLQDMELAVSHDLSRAIRDLDQAYRVAESQFNRRRAAADEVKAVEAAFEAGTRTLDLVLDAQRRLADAESAFFRAVVDYNIAIKDVHFRKGSLLEYDGVYLSEGPWPGKAYFDARKRARERDAGIFMDYGYTRPRVFSRGPYAQIIGHGGEVLHSNGQVHSDNGASPEELPDQRLQPLPTPDPQMQFPGNGSSTRAPQQPVIGAPQLGARPAQGGSAPFQWGALGLQLPGDQQAATAVQPVGYVTPQTNPTNEPFPRPATAPTHQPAAEWSRAQHSGAGTTLRR